MSKPLNVLIVEDSEEDTELLLREVEKGEYTVSYKRVETAEEFTRALTEKNWDLIIADYVMPSFDGMTALKMTRTGAVDIPFILVSGVMGEEAAVTAMKEGAQDYITKQNYTRLLPAIERELSEAILRREKKRIEKAAIRFAYYDPLTDLPNRTLFQERLHKAIQDSRHSNDSFAILMIDLDHFKEVNDTFGHDFGDLLLKQIAPRLSNVLRESDLTARFADANVTARFAGDEFSILLTRSNSHGAMIAARRILNIFEKPFVIDGVPIALDVSIGVAIYPDHGLSADQLIWHTAVAMHEAKITQAGCLLYVPEQDRHSPHRLALMGELRTAIDQHQLLFHYQPKIDLKSGSMVGAEALVRWQHPRFGLIPPNDFVQPAEQSGLIKPLTSWGLETALYQTKLWREIHPSFVVSVNLSARNLHDPSLYDEITTLFQKIGIPAETLEIEVTESALITNPGQARDNLKRLSRLGVTISVDDFGTGYTSFALLNQLPLNGLKIDQLFVKNILTDQKSAVLVNSMMVLAHTLGLFVVAEGVENQATKDHLQAIGCDFAQGFYINRPMPAEEMPRLLNPKTES